jgi:hypothetical protein
VHKACRPFNFKGSRYSSLHDDSTTRLTSSFIVGDKCSTGYIDTLVAVLATPGNRSAIVEFADRSPERITLRMVEATSRLARQRAVWSQIAVYERSGLKHRHTNP